MGKNNNKARITKKPLSVKNNWFSNVIKSMGYTGIDIIQDVFPATSEFVSDAGNASTALINSMRGKVSEERYMDRSISQVSPLVKMSSQGLKNALEDIKTGNFYNKEREAQYMQEADDELDAEMFGDFEDDFSFGDDFDESDIFTEESTEDDTKSNTSPKVQPVRVINDTTSPKDFMPVADIINKTSTRNTISTVKTIQGLGNQQKAFQIQAMMRDQEFNNTLFNSLASINDNLSTVLKIKVENESKFISAGIEFFGTHLEKMDEVIKNTKGDERTEAEIKDDNRAKDREEQPDIFLSEGGLNIEEYIKNIKYNLKNIDELSFLFDTAETVSGDDLLMKSYRCING